MNPLLRLATLVLLGVIGAASGTAALQNDVEAFDGSFRLDTGQTITGGYFVESGVGRWLYMDTQGLEVGGIFERAGERLLRAAPMSGPEGVEIEFVGEAESGYDELEWRRPGREPIRGVRVHPHTPREVGFRSEDGTNLEGRLLEPRCAGPHPVIVSVHGSGPVDRYGGPFHTFFLQHGLAVLAYDKRGYTSEPDDWIEPDFADLSADVAAAVRFVASQPGIDPDRIGIFGSSQGGWTGPPAAVAAPETDFLIVRVGPAQASLEVILHEIRQELRAAGLSGLDLDAAMDLRRELYELALAGERISATDSVVEPYLSETWYLEAFGEGLISERWSERWWEAAERNLAWSPEPALELFSGPVLWFLAERDENVPLVSTRAALERAFRTSPGSDQEIVVIDDVPHSFIRDSPEGPRYADGFFSRMGAWLAARGFARANCAATGSAP